MKAKQQLGFEILEPRQMYAHVDLPMLVELESRSEAYEDANRFSPERDSLHRDNRSVRASATELASRPMLESRTIQVIVLAPISRPTYVIQFVDSGRISTRSSATPTIETASQSSQQSSAIAATNSSVNVEVDSGDSPAIDTKVIMVASPKDSRSSDGLNASTTSLQAPASLQKSDREVRALNQAAVKPSSDYAFDEVLRQFSVDDQQRTNQQRFDQLFDDRDQEVTSATTRLSLSTQAPSSNDRAHLAIDDGFIALSNDWHIDDSTDAKPSESYHADDAWTQRIAFADSMVIKHRRTDANNFNEQLEYEDVASMWEHIAHVVLGGALFALSIAHLRLSHPAKWQHIARTLWSRRKHRVR
jgi:hypothetical protein